MMSILGCMGLPLSVWRLAHRQTAAPRIDTADRPARHTEQVSSRTDRDRLLGSAKPRCGPLFTARLGPVRLAGARLLAERSATASDRAGSHWVLCACTRLCLW